MSDQPIVVKRIKKAGHGHHGGAWKVAYADFVTAMMAFFLLLWLLNTVTQEQLEGISEYFSPITTTRHTSGSGGLLAGRSAARGGAFETEIARPKDVPLAPEPMENRVNRDVEGEPVDSAANVDVDALIRQREEEQFREAQAQLLDAIEQMPGLRAMANSIKIDRTPDGLRIQIMDQERMPMFPLGSASMYTHTHRLLELVSEVIRKMPQDVAITGHTDATPFAADNGYGNWELSADRANAARRVMFNQEVPEERISRVVGKAATDPLLPEDPAAPANRRLTIVLLRGTGDRSAAPPQAAAEPPHGSHPVEAAHGQPADAETGGATPDSDATADTDTGDAGHDEMGLGPASAEGH